MSGIAGFFNLDNKPASVADLKKMTAAISHRGPDGEGDWVSGPVALGHRMLWNTPESLEEKIPLIWKNGLYAVTADARIDNRSELVEILSGVLPDIRRATDSEIIAASYEKWGEGCCDKLIGDFSFVIWDSRTRKIFCGRDYFGIKPFYYHYRPGRLFAFGSEIKALLALPGMPRHLNETMMADHILWSGEDAEITFYKDIFRLPAAHHCVLSAENFTKRKYWSLDIHNEIRMKSDEAYAERMKEIFTEAVRCRLRSAYPVGSFLSGGLDSSSIVCTARQILAPEKKKLHTFSAVFTDVPQSDESEYIKEVTKLSGIEEHLIRADKISLFEGMDEIFWHLDEPFSSNFAVNWAGIYPEAKKNGIRVLLDGDGGDEVVSRGYPYLAELLGQGRFLEWINTAVPFSKRVRRHLWEVFWCLSLRPHVPTAFHWMWRYVRWGGRPLWLDDTLVNPVFFKRMGLKERAKAQLEYETRPARTVKEDDWQTIMSAPITCTLEMVNRLSNAHGLEHRYPFFDRRVAEYCFALPSDQKLYRGWTRIVMRRAMQGILPPKIQWRGHKTYPDTNMTHGLREYGKPLIDEMILKHSDLLDPYVDVPALKKNYERFMKNPDYISMTHVLQMTLLAAWIRQVRLEP